MGCGASRNEARTEQERERERARLRWRNYLDADYRRQAEEKERLAKSAKYQQEWDIREAAEVKWAAENSGGWRSEGIGVWGRLPEAKELIAQTHDKIRKAIPAGDSIADVALRHRAQNHATVLEQNHHLLEMIVANILAISLRGRRNGLLYVCEKENLYRIERTPDLAAEAIYVLAPSRELAALDNSFYLGLYDFLATAGISSRVQVRKQNYASTWIRFLRIEYTISEKAPPQSSLEEKKEEKPPAYGEA